MTRWGADAGYSHTPSDMTPVTPPTLDQLRELRAAVKQVKTEYHERRSVCTAEEHATLSAAVNDTVTALRAAEAASHG